MGYADCGTYGSLDEVCERLGLQRLEGLHCYDVYAGASQIETFFADQPGTYLLTDFLVKSFARTVETELGLDRWPELRDEYFRHYTRVVWLAQEQTPELLAAAEAAAARLDLPLTVVPTGNGGLENALANLLGATERGGAGSTARLAGARCGDVASCPAEACASALDATRSEPVAEVPHSSAEPSQKCEATSSSRRHEVHGSASCGARLRRLGVLWVHF